MGVYYRPIIQNDVSRPKSHFNLGAQNQWFDRCERLERGQKSNHISASSVPREVMKNLTSIRKSPVFDNFKSPLIMGILNLTPDSFSDGGQNFCAPNAIEAANRMIREGIDVIDIGGESTRPGAEQISDELEISRIESTISAIKSKQPHCIVSVDTRKSRVMRRVIELGVNFINDVSALSFDKKSTELLANRNLQVCLVHGGLNPKDMQENTTYEDVLLDVYDYLEERINSAVEGGIKKENIIVDPGIGFGKTASQNIRLIQKASLFHSLGCPVLYGVSRKAFIGRISGVNQAVDRFPGSISVALELIRQGVQFIRVHDTSETKQAVILWEAINDKNSTINGGLP